MAIWSWPSRYFSKPNPASFTEVFCAMILKLLKFSQVDNLWLIMRLYVFQVVWKVRNGVRFDNKSPFVLRALS